MILKDGGAVELPPVSREFQPALQAKVNFTGVDIHAVLAALRTLEKEDPTLDVVYDEEHAQLMVHVMGDLQLEVLQLQVDVQRIESEITTNKENIAQILVGKGVAQELIDEMLKVLATAEFARYAPVSDHAMQDLYNDTTKMINQLENNKL
jgi:hypothetical protein